MATQTSEQRSSLLDIPPELRLTIWEYCLADIEPAPVFVTKDRDTHPAQDYETYHGTAPLIRKLCLNIPALLQTCRTIRTEGHKVFFRSNVLLLRKEGFASDMSDIYPTCTGHEQLLDNIRSVRIENMVQGAPVQHDF